MARPTLNFDVEYAEIEIAGVWYSVKDINALIDRLRDIMQPRDWLDATRGELQQSVGILDNVIMLLTEGRYTREQVLAACQAQKDELKKQLKELA